MMDTSAVRRRFPSLARQHHGKPVLYFDNPAGTQVPQETIDGFTHYLQTSNANEGGLFITSEETDVFIGEARRQMAAFLGAASADEIVFGQNMTSLTFHLSHAVEHMLQPGDEIVTTRLEHDANVSPWLGLAERGITVKWIDINTEDATLDLASAEEAIGPRTRLVCVGYASNALGTINDVAHIARLAHAHGAWVFVDAVHYGPHGSIDVQALGCDLLVCSPYKFFGPHLGVLWGRYEVLDTLPAGHVRPSGDEPPDSWETGTQSHESLAGLLGTLSYLRSLSSATGDRAQYVDALTTIRGYERTLSEQLIPGIAAITGATVYGITDVAQFEHRVPTVSFTLAGREPKEVARALGERGIFSWAGNHYALEPLGRLGLSGTNRIGLVHYNTPPEIDRFLGALDEIAGSPPAE